MTEENCGDRGRIFLVLQILRFFVQILRNFGPKFCNGKMRDGGVAEGFEEGDEMWLEYSLCEDVVEKGTLEDVASSSGQFCMTVFVVHHQLLIVWVHQFNDREGRGLTK